MYKKKGKTMEFSDLKYIFLARLGGGIFWGGLNGKVAALDIQVICPVDKNPDYHTKN